MDINFCKLVFPVVFQELARTLQIQQCFVSTNNAYTQVQYNSSFPWRECTIWGYKSETILKFQTNLHHSDRHKESNKMGSTKIFDKLLAYGQLNSQVKNEHISKLDDQIWPVLLPQSYSPVSVVSALDAYVEQRWTAAHNGYEMEWSMPSEEEYNTSSGFRTVSFGWSIKTVDQSRFLRTGLQYPPLP